MRSGRDQRSHGRFNGNRPPQQQHGSPQRSQNFDSNGPSVRVRGTAHQIFERYVALAREAATSDDRIAAENFYQHAEHYFRINTASRDANSQDTMRPANPATVEMRAPPSAPSEIEADREQPWSRDADQ